MHKSLRSFLIVASTTACLAACSSTNHNLSTTGAPVYVTDQEIASSVQHKIEKTRGVSGQAIVISSQNGVITLNGSVKSQRAVDLAESAASTVPGVIAVKSNLVITH